MGQHMIVKWKSKPHPSDAACSLCLLSVFEADLLENIMFYWFS